MTSAAKKLVGKVVTALIKQHQHEWWELKHEVADSGESRNALYLFFYGPAMDLLQALPESAISILKAECPPQNGEYYISRTQPIEKR